MLKKLMKRTKTVKAMLAVGAAVTMLLGTSLTALAADNTTTPRVIAEADANVIATSDATQLYLTGSLTMVHDGAGSPDPVLVNNGDGSWVLIMYKGQTVALGVNNPYTDYTLYTPEIATVTRPTDAELDAGAEYICPVSSATYSYSDYYGYGDKYNSVIIYTHDTGTAVYNVQLEFDCSQTYIDATTGYECNYNAEILGVPETIGNTVTLAVYVLEAQEGVQEPLLTVSEKSNKEHNADNSWKADFSRQTLIGFRM